ncbi:MAG: ROK family protein [candidate division KSB1 bacterium]|nr:ROK family protein [candidate division KSB1 bacterium]
MDYRTDERIVLTLDAGGTNFVFSAIQGCREIIEPVRLPAHANDLQKSLQSLSDGFHQVKNKLSAKPVAISFAFPGPADYPRGIIGDLGNLPAYRGGVALGPMLEAEFDLPVFINNDGDLYAYGEAIDGFLPKVNSRLREYGTPRQFHNLFAVTLGTGFGGGLVSNNSLYIGDNAAACEIWITRNKLHPDSFAEEGASIRAVRRVYAEHADISFDDAPEPKDIYAIATGEKRGNREAAVKAFDELGEVVGDALANAVTLFDSLIVIGGGLSGAHALFLPAVVREMNSKLKTRGGESVDRLVQNVYNLEDEQQCQSFLKGEVTTITVPGTEELVKYDPEKRIGVGVASLETSQAVSVGAYAFALDNQYK